VVSGGGAAGGDGSDNDLGGFWIPLVDQSPIASAAADGQTTAKRGKHDKMDSSSSSAVVARPLLELVVSDTASLLKVKRMRAIGDAPSSSHISRNFVLGSEGWKKRKGAGGGKKKKGKAASSSSSSSSSSAAAAEDEDAEGEDGEEEDNEDEEDDDIQEGAEDGGRGGGLLTMLKERAEAPLFDKPFEPRLESQEGLGDAEADELAQVNQDEALDAAADQAALAPELAAEKAVTPLFGSKGAAAAAVKAAAAKEKSASSSSSAAVGDTAAAAAAAAVSSGDDSGLVPVGSTVMLEGLSNAKFNGKKGVVLTKKNADGRYGVRLSEGEGDSSASSAKPILIKEGNLAVLDSEGSKVVAGAASAVATASAAPEDEAAEKKKQQQQQQQAALERCAAVLGVRLDALGLVGLPSQTAAAAAAAAVTATQLQVLRDGRCLVDSLLRAADRDHNVAQSHYYSAGSGSVNQMVVEAKRAHRTLAQALDSHLAKAAAAGGDDDDGDDDAATAAGGGGGGGGGGFLRRNLAPHLQVEKGFLGARCAAGALLAGDTTSFAAINKGLALLNGLLEDEQKRLVRHRQVGGGGCVGTVGWVCLWVSIGEANEVEDKQVVVVTRRLLEHLSIFLSPLSPTE
jgi:hypothetical protein